MKKLGRIFSLWGGSLQALFTAPKIWSLLIISLIIHLGSLYVLFLFPRSGLRMVFGPIIKRFFGEVYLHYPFNFVILPHLDKIARQGLAIFPDFYLIAVLILLGNAFWRKEPLKLKSAFTDPLWKILPLLAYALTFALVLYGVQKVPAYVFQTIYTSAAGTNKQSDLFNTINQVLFYFSKFLGVIIQTFFIYTVPFILVEESGFLSALDRSIRLALKNFFTTFFLILVPTFILMGLEQLIKMPQPLIEKYFPEIVLYILLGIDTLYVFLNYLTIVPIIAIFNEKS